jgi:hypothetical protein
MNGDNDGAGAVPEFVIAWLEANPDVVRNWMTDPGFRESLVADPAQHIQGINADEVIAWVEERIRARGTERILGGHPGSLVAM